MRSWIPWSLLAALTILAVTSAAVGATTGRGAPTHLDLVSPFSVPAGTLQTAPTVVPAKFPPQAGFRGSENFCAVAPLSGTIHYDGASGELIGVLAVRVGGLPPNDEVFVNWSNNDVRAPVIASFTTDSVGSAVRSSVDVGRLGEVRGVELVLSAASVPNLALGRLEPC
jgi:hypothetical protein